MTDDRDRLDDDLLALVRREGRAPDLPADHVRRARERLEMRLFIGAGAGVGVAAATAAAVSATKAGASAGRSLMFAKIAGVVGIAFAGGFATDAILQREKRAASPVAAAPSAIVVSTAAPVASAPAVPAIDVNSLPATSAAAPSRPAPSAVSVDTTANERALLDQARRSLREGDGTKALELIDRHAHDYPRGALVEERELLRVNALVAVGRMDEAKTRAHAFKKRYPTSPFLPALDSQVRER